MKLIIIATMALTLSFSSWADSCIGTYKNILKANKVTTKEKAADLMVLGALSSTVAIISFGTGGPGLMLTGLISYGASGFLKGNAQEQRQEAKASISLIKDAKRSKGYFLQDATRMIRNHFQDNSITEKEVAENIKKNDEKMTYCKTDKVMGLAGILMHAGKDIIAERALNSQTKINTNQRGMVKKIPADDANSSEQSVEGGIDQ